MKKLTGGLFLPAVVVALSISLFEFQTLAVPYASGVTNGAGTIYFILNEAADNVTVTRNVGGAINLGALPKGTHSFALGGAATYEIAATKSAAPVWTLISDDLNPLVRFFGPRGIAVNQNPSDLRLFGRIYVADTAGGLTTDPPPESNRTTGDGIYILNADTSDALGRGDTASTAGFDWTANAVSPFKIEVGEDNQLYIGDFFDGNAGVRRTDPDVNTGEDVLSGVGLGNPTVHTTCNGSPIVTGSIANSDLTLWTIDGKWGNGFNRILRYDIGSGPLPHNSAPNAELGSGAVTSVADVQSDLDIAPDGKFFLCQNRQTNLTNTYEAARVNVKVFDTDGVTLLFDSLQVSLDRGHPNDILNSSRAIKVSPDGKYMAVIRNDTQTWIVGLTNGIPDLSQTNLLNTFGTTSTSTTSTGREVSFDAAGNLYASSATQEKLRIWSPGGTTTAKTKSDGTFTIVVPTTEVRVTASDANAAEAGPDTGTFTLSRTGDTASALTVRYTLTGTASNGVDYTMLATNVMFAPGATSTNISVTPINDSEAELSETVVLSLLSGTNYSVGGPGSATVSILDNEAPELSITAVQSRLLECFAGSEATFQVTRKGLLSSALTANLSYAPASGTDFNGPASVSVPASVVNANFDITPINDTAFEGNETVTASVASGAGYNVGAPSSANATIIDDETVPGMMLYSDNFDTDTSASWTVNTADAGADSFAQFFYDYSADGIPPAPGTTGGTTRGLKFRVNETSALAFGLSASPNSQNFAGDYRLKFDMWLNYNGPMDGGGGGSTQEGTAGIGTTGTQPQYPNAFPDPTGGWFNVAGDGGNGNVNGDYNAYTGPTVVPDGSGSYNAGTAAGVRENFNAYYNIWGSVMAPASQVTAHPAQAGVTPVGVIGMSWHCVAITKIGETVNWSIDGVSIATITNGNPNAFTTTGNIFLGYYDRYVSLSDNPAVTFGLYDNVKVETAVLQPIITSIKIVGGNVEIEFSAGASDAPGDFTLQSAGAVTGTYNDVVLGTTISDPPPMGDGSFKAVRAMSGSMQFYRIRR